QRFGQVNQGGRSKIDIARAARAGHGIGEQVSPRSDDQSLSVTRFLKSAVRLDALICTRTAFAEDVIPRGDMQHRHADASGMAVDVSAIPVLAVVGMFNVIGEIWRGLLQQLAPILDWQVAIPLLGERREGVQAETGFAGNGELSAFDILLSLFKKIVPLEPPECVEPFEDRIGI